MSKTGTFLPFFMPFQTGPRPDGGDGYRYASVTDQARWILDCATQLIWHEVQDRSGKQVVERGIAGVAITYSANEGQTARICETYQRGGWHTQTSGAGQAQVMHAMETLLGSTHASLQTRMRIAPITTIPNPPLQQPDADMVDRDLGNIDSTLLARGWVVLGWINQSSFPAFAIGGGVNQNLPAAIVDRIQAGLRGLTTRYSL